MSLTAWIYLFFLSFFWGASFYFVEVGLDYLSPAWLVSLRLIIGALGLYLWLTFRAIRLPRTRQFWASVMVMGILNNSLPFWLIAWGQLSVTGGMASILNANTAFFGVITAALFLKLEAFRLNRLIGVLIGIFGVAIAIGLEAFYDFATVGLGQLAIVLATVFYALAGVWGKLKLAGYKPIEGACGMLICSALLSVPIGFISSGLPDMRLFRTENIFDLFQLIVGIGLFGTALAYPLYFKILDLAGASNLLLVTIIVPIFALIFDALLLDQQVSLSDMIGFCFVVFGLSVMDGRLYKRKIPSD